MFKRSASAIIICILLTGLHACKKDPDMETSRLFRPVIKGSLESDGNYIKAAWERIKGASNYTVEISRDSFQTIDRSVVLDSARTIFEGLKWDQKYQLQVRANATDTVLNSKMSYLGEIKTPRFPTILNIPGIADINATQVRVSWTTNGAAVTTVKILKASDSSVVQEIALTGVDVAANFKLVSGLTPSASYIIFLYSGTSVRGWANFSTSAPLSGNIIDLTLIIGRPLVLMDTLPLIESGSTVLLKKGESYTINSAYAMSKSVTITSGDDLIATQPPLIYFENNFTFAAGATVDYVRFEKVNMRSNDYGNRNVFNVNVACTVGEISFNSCKIEVFRGITRFQNQDITVGKFSLNNCIADSLKNYGVLTVDGAGSLVQNINVTNSTIYKCEKFLTSALPTRTMVSLNVENCTINECPLGGTGATGTGNSLIDCVNMKFSGGLVFKGNIVGPGWKRDNVMVRGVRPGNASVDGAGNYTTADFTVNTDSPIPAATVYSKPSTDLFTDPAIGNFKIKDNTFTGKSSAGDPRWRL